MAAFSMVSVSRGVRIGAARGVLGALKARGVPGVRGADRGVAAIVVVVQEEKRDLQSADRAVFFGSRMLAIDKHTALSLAAAFTAGWIVHSLLVSYADDDDDEIEQPPKRANHV